ncbi:MULTISPECIES: ectoine/hydroxyectoine ABC transporter permease subunit EhuD [unclassified Microbacterium]|uniref:ectoine/hydroxyectoine ABC transporter permease subunit EhuD n=1 Tax=unclassified Microbacterium TaxID=2609290 RepID=UPI00097EE47D|nr:ectoine/hydroxyectoine ABC transporter permease subunit EhuD [Microbacterium sp. JB110]RCS57840.1 ectoine/hydroxyectoine ABC transporter permease subunit EhuD [Microbacterium sp. JB110]SJM56955.1 probable amino acid ABC transporter integral membrane protein [Frigoribacterium sp. JB110]
MIDSTLWRWDHVWAALPDMLLKFVTVTLLVTIIGSIIAALLGLLIALLRRSVPRPVAAIITFVADFIRMTPIIIQLLFIYFAFTSLDPILIGIVVFGVHYATFMSEVYRAGIDSIPRGQWEATTALSMPRGRTWTAVIIPQAVRATAPALGNYVISMFKETPFLTAIAVVDMLGSAMAYGGSHFRSIEVVTIAGLLFLIASYPTSLLVTRLEKRLAFTS